MNRRFKASILSSIFVVCTLTAPRAQANGLREFVLSCTYGVLAGTMMGAATLAFTERPSDHLYRVARGASLGLYAGILLGAYVVFVVGDGTEEVPEDDEQLPEGLGWNRRFQLNHNLKISAHTAQPTFEFRPVVNEYGFNGGSLHYSVYNF